MSDQIVVLERLEYLLEREAEAFESGDTPALEAIVAERAGLLAELTPPTAPELAPLVQRIERARVRNLQLVTGCIAELGRQRGAVGRQRTNLSGYAPRGRVAARPRYLDASA